ncbi:MAG: hypothetical protein RL026_1251 [Pseudomonadota bacterium]
MPSSVQKTPSEALPPVPDRIGKYMVVNEVGRGTSGVVFLSHDPYYGRDVAIKVYHGGADGDAERAAVSHKMFLSEAHMVGMLQHPNILPIYDAGEENGRCYVVTEHVHGARTLSAFCRAGNLLPVDMVVEIIFKCAKALHYAHSRGVIHRDIKPSNIMLTQDGDVRIIDFGIALIAGTETRIEGIAGSPSYMSPEQVRGVELTHHSDLYSLGAVMYELLTGARPFRAGNLPKLLHQVVYGAPAPLHSLRPDIPDELETVVATALDKEPSRRYRNGAEFAAALTRVHQKLRQRTGGIEQEEQFALLRRLKFFHEFSHAEIREVLRAGSWQEYLPGEAIVNEGELDDRFYVLLSGSCDVERNASVVGKLAAGDCFGEISYLPGARRAASVRARSAVSVLRVSATLLEQVSAASQLRFTKVFLRSMILRLQGTERPTLN